MHIRRNGDQKKYIETSVLSNGGTTTDAKEKSRNYYENLCMRAVNQSIGRSIRHINDYSIIYLVDRRFSTPRIQNKLSQWVKERISITTTRNNNNNSIYTLWSQLLISSIYIR